MSTAVKEKAQNNTNDAAAILQEKLSSLMNSNEYIQWLKTASTFHNYSLRNTLMILAQNPEATRVAGYNAWKCLGRQVRRGEKGISIFAPVIKKVKVDEDENGEPVFEQTISFHIAKVFDISQTDGEPLPEMEVTRLDGDVADYDKLLEGLKQVAKIPVSFEHFDNPDLNGFYHRKEVRIAVRAGMSKAQTLKTLIHEMAHAFMHGEDSQERKSKKEIQAESVAFIVCHHLGIDSSSYTLGYLGGWAEEEGLKAFESSLGEIKKCASKIISELDKLGLS